MQEYLNHSPDPDNFDVVSTMDELPLWSAPFGLSLLGTVILKKNMNVLDIGCGAGFPLVEIAERLGNSSTVYGIDPWERALERIRLKMKVYNLTNIELVNGIAEEMPFEDNFFDLIVSNNGINNVNDMNTVIKECYRTAKPGAQIVLTVNLEDTMIEFYNIFKEVLKEIKLKEAIEKVDEHIYSKRKPLEEIKNMLAGAGFNIQSANKDSFNLRFADGTAFLNHHLIKFWFMDAWKKIVKNNNLENIFALLEKKLNEKADADGELNLTVPFITIDSKKENN